MVILVTVRSSLLRSLCLLARPIAVRNILEKGVRSLCGTHIYLSSLPHICWLSSFGLFTFE